MIEEHLEVLNILMDVEKNVLLNFETRVHEFVKISMKKGTKI
jgi:hypothetical protein